MTVAELKQEQALEHVEAATARRDTADVPVVRPAAEVVTAVEGSAATAAGPRAPEVRPAVPTTPAPEFTRRERIAAPPRQGRWIQVRGEAPVIPLVLHRDSIADVMSALSAETGVSIVLSNDPIVRDMVLTAEVRDLPWHLALEAVLQAHGLRAIQLGSGVINVVTEGQAERDRVPEPLDLRFLTAKEIQPALAGIVESGADSAYSKVVVYGDEETSRRLVIYASAEKLAQVRTLVAKMDRRPPNVSVEARIVAVNRDKMRKVGVAYSLGRMRNDSTGQYMPAMEIRDVTPQGGITSTNGPAFEFMQRLGGTGRVDVNVFVDAVIGRGMAETQTTPMITTLSDVPALIRVGDAFVLPNNQPILAGGAYYPGQDGGYGGGQQGQQGMGGMPQQPGGYGDGRGGLQPGGVGGMQPGYGATAGGFTRFETGTALRVTPYVLGDGLIRVKIDLERDGGALSPDGRSITGGNQAAYSDVIVPVGTPIVMGGLTVNAKSSGSSGVPILSKLPLIGPLFRVDESADRYQDLIIIVTPRIDDEDYDLATR